MSVKANMESLITRGSLAFYTGNRRQACKAHCSISRRWEHTQQKCLQAAGVLVSSLVLPLSAHSLVPDNRIERVYSVRPPPERTVKKHSADSLELTDDESVGKSASNEAGDGSVSFLGKYSLSGRAIASSPPTQDGGSQLVSNVKKYFSDTTGNNSLQLRQVSHTKEDNGTVLSFVQESQGITIEGTYALAKVNNGFLQYSRHLLVDPPRVDADARIKSHEATGVATKGLGLLAKSSKAGKEPPRLTIIYDNGKPILAWAVSVDTEAPFGSWTSYVDAQRGDQVVRVRKSLSAVSGRITSCIERSCQNDNPEKGPLPYSEWNTGKTTDEQGSFSDPNNGKSSEVTLNGKYFAVRDSEGYSVNREFPLASGFNELFLKDAPLSQTDPYFHANRVRTWLVNTVSSILSKPQLSSWTDSQVRINVNLNDTCNAYYNGSLNFFKEDSRCNNSGRVAKIVYHEYGHGIHDHLTANSSTFDPIVSEGIADYVAATITNDPQMTGLGGCTEVLQGSRTQRKCLNKYTYCKGAQCDTHPGDEEHEPAPVMCGAWWEFRDSMIKRYGEDAGRLKADQIFLRFLSRVTDMGSAYTSAIAADDDIDDDPSNGTTHSCEINKAFVGSNNGDFAHFPDSLGQRVPCKPAVSDS